MTKPNEIEQALITAAANVLEYENGIHKAIATADASENLVLCIQVALVPRTHIQRYTSSMAHLYEHEQKDWPPIVTDESRSIRH